MVHPPMGPAAAAGLATEGHPAARAAGPRRIAVMPAFNEEPTIEGVLDDLYPRIDRLVIVDDGSVDATGSIVDQWAAGRENVSVIHFPQNRGLSAALRAGWNAVRDMLANGEVSADDIAFSIDADGQHEPAALDGMINHLIENNAACVIGLRDMGYHSAYKRFGNKVMTWIARASGGFKFEDVESGYRVFRVGPLLRAQQYYEGFKYSETVEVAVILARLGYPLCNSYPIAIPVARTRTRLYDAAVDAVCMPLAWYRLSCQRAMDGAPERFKFALWLAPAIIGIALAALLAILLKPFYLGDDSAHSYAHVWYLSQSIWNAHDLPLRMSQLENGKAMTFPYAFIPWLPTALVYPAFGDWAVTLSYVVGVLFAMAAALWFRPGLRNPALFGLFLLNPLLWNGVTQFQLATFWAFGFVLAGAALFERRRRAAATGAFALGIVCHPMLGLAAIVMYVGIEWYRLKGAPRPLIAAAALAALLASPAILMFLATPAIHNAGLVAIALTGGDNLRRLTIVALVFALPAAAAFVQRHERLLYSLGGASTLGVLLWVAPSGLWSRSTPQFSDYLAGAPVDHAHSYRVMTQNNREDGMVEFMKAGAVLSNEFFSESENRRSFSSLDQYECLLATRNAGHVILTGGYQRHWRTNERALLDRMAMEGRAQREYESSGGTVAYQVSPRQDARKGSLRACFA